MTVRHVNLLAVVLVAGVAGARPAAGQRDRSADLAAFEARFLEVDQSYTDEARAEAMGRYAAVKQAAGDLSEAELELKLAEIAALADNGHTGVLVGRWTGAYNRMGVRFLITDDGLHVADAIAAHEDLIGSEVATLAGHSLGALRETWARYYPGRAGRRDDALHLFIESPELLHAAGVSDVPESIELILEGGAIAKVGVTDRWPEPEGVWRWLPQARAIELMEAGRIRGNPLYLQEPETLFRFVELPEAGAVYLQFRANHQFGDGASMRRQASQALDRLRTLSPRVVIVDQRFNFGGNLNNTRALMQAIPEIVGPDGRVLAIVSGRTFSAGIASLGYLKQAGGERVTIVGAPVGDRLEFWAEGEPLRLPHSGATFGVATERHNYRTGCPEDDCHGSIRRHPIRVESLEPDVQPEVTYADVVEGRDPYLEEALRLAAK
jgi:hypothetical protein